jgi:hypothetical protein
LLDELLAVLPEGRTELQLGCQGESWLSCTRQKLGRFPGGLLKEGAAGDSAEGEAEGEDDTELAFFFLF